MSGAAPAADALALGVDFGARGVKVILLRRASTRLMVELAGAFPLPAGSVHEGALTEPRAVGRLLSKYLDATELRPTRAVFSIPSGLAVLRWLHLPALEPGELREAARFKVRRHLPFPVEEAYVEAIAPAGDDASRADGPTMIAAVRRRAVDSRAEALLHAGIEPVRAELEAQALVRVMQRRLDRQGALWRHASLTIIDIGADSTTMYVLQGGRLQFIRALRFGAGIFHAAVGAALDADSETVARALGHPESRLREDGRLTFPLGDDHAIVDVRPELDRFSREIMRLMRYFRSLHPERSYAGILDNAVLCGGIVGLPGLARFLGSNLGLRIELARPIQGLVTRFNRDTFAEVSHRQEALAAAMGLAMAGLSPSETVQEGKRERGYVWRRSA